MTDPPQEAPEVREKTRGPTRKTQSERKGVFVDKHRFINRVGRKTGTFKTRGFVDKRKK